MFDRQRRHYCLIIYRTTKIKYMRVCCIKLFLVSYYITTNFTYITFDFFEPMLFQEIIYIWLDKNKIKKPG